ncbi:glycosyltransferase [Paracoccus sp. MC1854]|uniref:glycosyltransferase family 2 protein n=1 Tax=Paracoccus sp. MC1854 TaxID=2760306 RepID=UPI00160408F2|nr:glycosyltransferase [Paracoccus sp. MC1854]MBB1492625.1 glycosyltransferase [Paracoccus sp. MC1854]
MKISFAIFAHNEEENIPDLLLDLSKQDILLDSDIDVRFVLLANGCTDDTVAAARSALSTLPPEFSAHVEVLDLVESGKSRTAHRFIHEFSRPDDDLLGFMDGDIRIPMPTALRDMSTELYDRSNLVVITSHPIKDINFGASSKGFIPRLIGSGADSLTDWKKSICGQLFLARTGALRRIGLPIGLPVEDGFFRAMLLTGLFSHPEDLNLIDGHQDVFHVYSSIKTLPELVRHQTRIVIGSAINSAIYQKVRNEAVNESEAHDMLMKAAVDEEWIPTLIRQELPRLPFGYIPFEFLSNRWRRYIQRKKFGAKPTLNLFLGTGLDLTVWILASYKMHRGTGAGHW